MKTKIRDEKWSVAKGVNRIASHKTSDGETWEDGNVITPHGFVDCYAQGSESFKAQTRLDFFHNGHVHTRYWNRRYSKRGMSMIAKKFAAEISSLK